MKKPGCFHLLFNMPFYCHTQTTVISLNSPAVNQHFGYCKICSVVSGTNMHLEISLDTRNVLAEGCVYCEKANICNWQTSLFVGSFVPKYSNITLQLVVV